MKKSSMVHYNTPAEKTRYVLFRGICNDCPLKSAIYNIIGFILIISLIVKFLIIYKYNFIPANLQIYGWSEFLISFQGGFVRRGLLGEILFWITSSTGVLPHYIIFALCVSAYIFVLVFLWRKFRERGYCWWLILSPLLCGFIVALIRKDYILYSILIGMCFLVKDANPSMLKRIIATILALLGLYLHEAFMFWGIPIFSLVLLTQKKQFKVNALFIGILLVNFGVLCYFKGDSYAAHTIVDKWKELLPPESNISYTDRNSIGALSWDLWTTVKFHIMQNTGGRALNFMGVLFWPICFCVVYYYLSFFFIAFRPSKSIYNSNVQCRLSYMYLFTSLCMLPLFAMLSCDYGRLFQHVTMSSLLAFLILDISVQNRIMPIRISSKIIKMNLIISKQFVPTKGLVITILLFFGISSSNFDLYSSLRESPVGSAIYGTIAYVLSFVEQLV